ncbi:MAG: hypothetical protein PWP07_1900 [Epulopiscium sp.]|jgi:membrane-associated phospholipid phosphatase|uniref:phosphatase PAP2 family protein n=1 Tax=Defluviitalea raffinosedens TaxID=1450156 RepID=UPI0017505E18|nr:phosphatase PAP2 family protein [Defluviitalea raffinosedens]MBM7685944.1 membrane-associated phospholipid phosphatase [Defluviitalea raffinosedens]MDK2788655.1 hypothetical protein [Candidatus Epulonipiscium sp.]HHW68160.1 phosphatase PAP2 family protein [Candidatus Epulonipiscium sp.]
MEIQLEILKYIQSFRSDFLDHFFELITLTGEETFLVLVFSFIYCCIHKDFGYRLGFFLLSNVIFNSGLKNFFHTARPIGKLGITSLRLETATGYSFPSGHTQVASGFWMMIMNYVHKKWMYILGAFMIALIGLSRLYLGVHWPVDVIGGIVFSCIWFVFINVSMNYAEKTQKSLIFVLIFMILGFIIVMVRGVNEIKMFGCLTGLFFGYLIETKYIHFKIQGNLARRIISWLLGIITLILIKYGLKAILPSNNISYFLQYVLICMWIIAGIPFFFINIIQKNN